MAVTLEVAEVGKDFLIPVIDSVSFDVEAGDFVCLLGPNGCGKTTLLRIVGGLEAPSRGTVRLGGEPVLGSGRHTRKVAMVFQEDRLLPWLTLRQNVELVQKPLGADAALRRRTADRYLRLAGLAGFEDYYPARVSGGMRQRAAIARALAIEPDLLLMDEPFGALDAQTRSLMQGELLGIWQRTPKTVIFVTHDVQEAVYLAERVFVMSARPGRIKAIVDTRFEKDAHVFRTPAFVEKVDEIWTLVREEAIKAQGTRAS
ncbi:MAG: ABC transporter ATP-binding protein [Xanthobacteraceae bacterium]